MTPPPYVPSQGVLDAIGNALSEALGLSLYGARGIDANPPSESPPPQSPPLESPPLERPPRVPTG